MKHIDSSLVNSSLLAYLVKPKYPITKYAEPLVIARIWG